MKSKERENLRNMSVDELNVQVREIGKQMFQMKFKRISTPLENPLQIRTARRKAAIIKTLLRAKKGTALSQSAAEVKK